MFRENNNGHIRDGASCQRPCPAAFTGNSISFAFPFFLPYSKVAGTIRVWLMSLTICLLSCRFRFASLTASLQDAVRICSSPPFLHARATRYCSGLNDLQTTVPSNCVSQPPLLTKRTLYRSVGFNAARRESEERGGRARVLRAKLHRAVIPFDKTQYQLRLMQRRRILFHTHVLDYRLPP